MSKWIKDYTPYQSQKKVVSVFIEMLRTKGLGYFTKKFSYKILFPPLQRFFTNTHFELNGESYKYSRHSFETGHSTERAVEIPIISRKLRTIEVECKNPTVLEIGNVLGHCIGKSGWDIVDKYEIAPGVINQDILHFSPTSQYDLIFSISTFEHIGFDEDDKDPTKIRKCLEHVITSLLKENGEVVITVPLGWNEFLDDDIRNEALPVDRTDFLHRLDWAGNWVQVSKDEVRYKYGKYIGADYLAVLYYKKSSRT